MPAEDQASARRTARPYDRRDERGHQELRDGQIAELQLEVNKLNMKTDPSPAVQVKAPAVYVPRFLLIKTAGVGL